MSHQTNGLEIQQVFESVYSDIETPHQKCSILNVVTSSKYETFTSIFDNMQLKCLSEVQFLYMKLVLIIILDMIDISDLAMRYKPLFALNISCMNAITLLRLFHAATPI